MTAPTRASAAYPHLLHNRFAGDAAGSGPVLAEEACFRQAGARVRFHGERQDTSSLGWRRLLAFEPYTSYSLHWFPYELTRCMNLRDSTVSTRALYGNIKYRPAFPRLHPRGASAALPAHDEFGRRRP